MTQALHPGSEVFTRVAHFPGRKLPLERTVLKRLTFLAAALVATAGSSVAQDLNGAGATFPNPIYSKWFSDYATATGV